MKTVISISASGMKFIYSDALRGLLSHGEASITRMSHVEPGDPVREQDPLKWYVDFAPSGHSVILGPCDTRSQALAEEIKWINHNVLGTATHAPKRRIKALSEF